MAISGSRFNTKSNGRDAKARQQQAPAPQPKSEKQESPFTRGKNIAVRVEGPLVQNGQAVGVRGSNAMTGEQVAIAFMSPARAAEILVKKGTTVEQRAAYYLTSFQKRVDPAAVKPGSVVAINDVFSEKGQKTLQGRWPVVLQEPGAPHDLARAGLVEAAYLPAKGDEKRFVISVFQDNEARLLQREDWKAISSLFNPLEADGKLSQLKMMVTAQSRDGEAAAYFLGHSLVKGEGGWTDKTTELMETLFEIDPQTKIARSEGPLANEATAVMKHLVTEQLHGKHSGHAAGIIAATLFKDPEAIFKSFQYRQDVTEEDKLSIRDLMVKVLDGEVRAAIVPGAQYLPLGFMNERLAHSDRALSGYGYYSGFVGLRSQIHPEGKDPVELPTARVHALIAEEGGYNVQKMKLHEVAQMVFNQIDRAPASTQEHSYGAQMGG